MLLLVAGLVVGGAAVKRWSASEFDLRQRESALHSSTHPDDQLSPADRRLLDRALRSIPDEEE
jgi:hypothetical protein